MKQYLGRSTSEFEFFPLGDYQEPLELRAIPFLVSRFSFGTAKLHRVSERCQNRLISKAIDLGMTHFDTSPYYGYGAAERALREPLTRNGNVTIATKVGIYPPKFREHRNTSMKLRKIVGKVCPSFNKKEVDFSISRISESLCGSLKRLGRDHTDILYLHEPIIDLIKTDELVRFLENLIFEGKVRTFGVSGPMRDLVKIREVSPSLCRVIQTDYKSYCEFAGLGVNPQFFFGVFPQVLKCIDVLETMGSSSVLYTTTSEHHMDIFSK